MLGVALLAVFSLGCTPKYEQPELGARKAEILNPKSKLPFEIPSSMDAVRAQKEDVPFDSPDPSFPFGFGLSYE